MTPEAVGSRPSFYPNAYLGLSSSVGRAQGWKLWGRWFESNLRHLTKLFFTKVMSGAPHLFFANKTFRAKNLTLLLPDKLLYYLALHVKFATSARSSQLVEIFAYENPNTSTTASQHPLPSPGILVYQFHNLFSQERLFVFSTGLGISKAPNPKSLDELFVSSNWLEREVSEMHAITFEGKKDLRNLMLQYGDSSAPFLKSYPSVGTKEVFYDSVTDTLVQVPVSLQL